MSRHSSISRDGIISGISRCGTLSQFARESGYSREHLSRVLHNSRKQSSTSIINKISSLYRNLVPTTPNPVEHVKSLTKLNTLIIGDTHIPFEHKDYLKFCLNVKETYKCTRIIHIGDEVDNHAMSYHEHDPDGLSAGAEADAAEKSLKEWYKAFPEMYLCNGNHTVLASRQARTAGMASRFIRTNAEAFQAPQTWKWADQWVFDDIVYQHGLGVSGALGMRTKAISNMMSTVIGHLHSFAGVSFITTFNQRIFGMNVGCGIDIDSYAMRYAKDSKNRAVLGCGVVIDGKLPIFVPMMLGQKVRYI